MQILDNGLHVEHGEFRYLWLRLTDDGREFFRVVSLRELTSLAIDDKELEDYNVMGRQWGAVRGLYNAGVDFVYSAAGIFTPDHVGVVQFYGAAANADSLDAAARLADSRLKAVLGTLAAGYQQSKTRPPLMRWMEWYLDFITRRAHNAVAVLGHPDPRDARRGYNLDDSSGNDDLASEQNEMLFRGLAKLRKDFIFQVTADRIGRRDLTHSMRRLQVLASQVASRRRGAISIGASLSIPLAAALANSVGGNASRGHSTSHSHVKTSSHGWGNSHTDSYAHTESESHSVGGSESHSVTVTHSEGSSVTLSEAQSVNRSHTVGNSVTHSQSDGVTRTMGSGSSWGSSQGGSHSQSSVQTWGSAHGQQVSHGVSSGHTESSGVSIGQSNSQSSGGSQTAGTSHSSVNTNSASATAGVSASAGVPGVASGSVHASGTVGHSHSEADGQSQSVGSNWSSGHTQSQNISAGQADSVGHSTNVGVSSSQSVGGSRSQSSGSSWSRSQGGSSFQSTSGSHTEGTAVSKSQSDTVGRSETRGKAYSVQEGESVAVSDGWSRSWQHTKGTADTWGTADSKQESWNEGDATGQTQAVALGRGGTMGLTRGISAGLLPGISIGRSWQTEDHVADRLAQVLTQLHTMFNQAAHEGGFLAEAVLFTGDDTAAEAASTLVPQAFHGPNTPTPVLTVQPDGEERKVLLSHALAFYPSRLAAPNDFMGGILGGRYSTVLTTQQLAAYTAPAIFREGTVRILPAIPKKGLGYYPDMPGDVVLGHQYSPETADLTSAPVRLDKRRFMHIMFAGATGFGKSVGAERLAYEVVLNWNMRVVVLDFGAGWRKLLNAPGIEHLVDIRQLVPHGVRPLRWNPLQVSRHIVPEVQMAAFVDVFGNIAQLGVKQQKHRFFDVVEHVYLRAGVLVNDPKVLNDSQWGEVQPDEAFIAQPGRSLRSLDAETRQAIAVHRSKRVSLQQLYEEVERRRDALPARDQVGRGILEGIMARLQTLLRGATAQQFAAGDDAIDVADLGEQNGKRLLILEGGKFLDQFSKAWLLSWAGWLIYQDMVQKREKQLISGDAELTMIFEEANVLFTGLSQRDENGGGVTVAEQYDNMFRDSRKYGVRFVVITQSPSLIPPGVISSCSSIFVGFLSDPKDKDLALSALAKSEKGFVDEPWRRFISDQNIGMMLGRLPYSFDRAEMRPFLMRPLILNAGEPMDAEIAAKLGRISLN